MTQQINIERIPPQAIESEMAILGSIMIEPESYYKINIQPEMFYRSAHQKIFQVIRDLSSQENASFDMLAVSEELKKKQWLEEIGGEYYLTEICEAVPSAAVIEYHAGIVKEKYYQRKIINGLYLIQQEAYTLKPSETAERLSELSIINVEENKNEVFESWKETRLRTYAEIENQDNKTKIRNIKGLWGLKKYLKSGELIVISGHSSHGKTALATQIALENSLDYWTLIFSMEMTKAEVTGRLLCQLAEVNTIHFFESGLTPDENERLQNAEQELKIKIDDTPFISFEYIEIMARRMKLRLGLDMIVIDYLQLMNLADGETQELKVSNTTKQFKKIAKNMNIPILLISQLTKDSDGKRVRPTLGRLKYSTAIEQDADTVIFSYLPDPDDKTKARLMIDKNRNGATGEKDAIFLKECTKFE